MIQTQSRLEEEELQAFGYRQVVVLVHPDPGTYCPGVVCTSDTDDTTAKVILDDILKRYSRAWHRLADM